MLTALLLLTATSLHGDPLPGSPTPAETRIQRSLTRLAERPDDPESFNRLAFALARRARETADPSFYERGEAALRTSFALDSDNAGARRTRAWILLGQHRFEEALEVADRLHREVPDDLMTYGLLVDAHIELGNLSAAEEDWLDLEDRASGG